jgi:hypothetical protein
VPEIAEMLATGASTVLVSPEPFLVVFRFLEVERVKFPSMRRPNFGNLTPEIKSIVLGLTLVKIAPSSFMLGMV